MEVISLICNPGCTPEPNPARISDSTAGLGCGTRGALTARQGEEREEGREEEEGGLLKSVSRKAMADGEMEDMQAARGLA